MKKIILFVLIQTFQFTSFYGQRDNSSNIKKINGHFRTPAITYNLNYSPSNRIAANIGFLQFNYQSYNVRGTSPIITWGPSLTFGVNYHLVKEKIDYNSVISIEINNFFGPAICGKTGIGIITDFDTYMPTLNMEAGYCGLAGFSQFNYGSINYGIEIPLLASPEYNITHKIIFSVNIGIVEKIRISKNDSYF